MAPLGKNEKKERENRVKLSIAAEQMTNKKEKRERDRQLDKNNDGKF